MFIVFIFHLFAVSKVRLDAGKLVDVRGGKNKEKFRSEECIRKDLKNPGEDKES